MTLHHRFDHVPSILAVHCDSHSKDCNNHDSNNNKKYGSKRTRRMRRFMSRLRKGPLGPFVNVAASYPRLSFTVTLLLLVVALFFAVSPAPNQQLHDIHSRSLEMIKRNRQSLHKKFKAFRNNHKKNRRKNKGRGHPKEEEEEEETETTNEIHESFERYRRFADRHLKNLKAVVEDEDCMSRVFDVTSPNYNSEDATRVFKKCKLLVLRNVFDADYIESYKTSLVTPYIHGLLTGKITQYGATTNGPHDEFFVERQEKRYEILLTRDMVPPSLVANVDILDILSHESILGQNMVMHSGGMTLAEGGAVAQSWHEDETYLFGAESFTSSGVAGHDLPSYAATVAVPLLDLKREHGPTEFCMGSPTVQGLPIWGREDIADQMSQYLRDPSAWVEDEDSLLRQFVAYTHNGCHPRFWRSPSAKRGDVVIFDYQLKHRGGWNNSPEARSVLLLTYGRTWFKDTNFRNYDPSEITFDDDELDEDYLNYYWALTTPTRLAIPDKVTPCKDDHDCGMDGTFDLRDTTELQRHDTPDKDNPLYKEGNHVVSNKDAFMNDDEPPPRLFLNDEDLGPLPPGHSTEVFAGIGDVLTLRKGDDSSSQEHKSWDVHYTGQVVFTADM